MKGKPLEGEFDPIVEIGSLNVDQQPGNRCVQMLVRRASLQVAGAHPQAQQQDGEQRQRDDSRSRQCDLTMIGRDFPGSRFVGNDGVADDLRRRRDPGPGTPATSRRSGAGWSQADWHARQGRGPLRIEDRQTRNHRWPRALRWTNSGLRVQCQFEDSNRKLAIDRRWQRVARRGKPGQRILQQGIVALESFHQRFLLPGPRGNRLYGSLNAGRLGKSPEPVQALLGEREIVIHGIIIAEEAGTRVKQISLKGPFGKRILVDRAQRRARPEAIFAAGPDDRGEETDRHDRRDGGCQTDQP